MSISRSDALQAVPSLGLDCVRRWPSREAKEWAARFLEKSKTCEQVAAIVAVGSAVRKASYAADVDFVYLFDAPKPEIELPPIDVDVRGYPRNQANQLIASGHELLGWAIMLGCLVFERDSCWTELHARWKNDVPLPSAEVSRERAARADQHWRHLNSIGDCDAAIEQRVSSLTHLARAILVEAGVYPASRPELSRQLIQIGQVPIATELDEALKERERLNSRA